MTTIIPAYNEGDTIGNTISQLIRSMKEQPLPYEVIVVDDGSLDGTGVIAKEYGATKVIRNFQNLGKGAAIASGVSASSGSIIVLMDADGTYNPSDIPRLVSPILDGYADLAVGTRFFAKKGTPFRFLGNYLLLSLFKLLTGMNTTYVWSGLRAFRADKFKDIMRDNSATSGFDFDLETLYFAKKKNYRVVEVPLRTRLRWSVGYSESKLVSILNIFRILLRWSLLRREEE